jgi:hypothetical protein
VDGSVNPETMECFYLQGGEIVMEMSFGVRVNVPPIIVSPPSVCSMSAPQSLKRIPLPSHQQFEHL